MALGFNVPVLIAQFTALALMIGIVVLLVWCALRMSRGRGEVYPRAGAPFHSTTPLRRRRAPSDAGATLPQATPSARPTSCEIWNT